jgi:pyruvate dehydrogenase E2 component (dihydrolipoamide acetyltransferase)
MAFPVIMPRQGQSVESCIISEIRKKKGDSVSVGDILFVYETDKATFEEEAKAVGVMLEVFFSEGDEVPVLTNVCVFGREGESVEEFRPGKAGEVKTAAAREGKPETEPEAEPKSAREAAPGYMDLTRKEESASGISPRAKELAKKKGVDASRLKGSGPQGRIIERDVLEAAERTRMSSLAGRMVKEDPSLTATVGTGLAGMIRGQDLQSGTGAGNADFEIRPLNAIRKLIAKAMHQSLQNAAQLTHHLGADASRITGLRKTIKRAFEEGRSADITLNDMVCFAAIRALKEFPQANAHFMGESIKYFSKVHLGVAVDTDRGLMVPAVRNADDLTVSELSVKIKELAAACRKGSVDPEVLSGDAASFTVSNLGSYGVEMFTPVINLPQVAILGVNTTVLRPKELSDGTIGFIPYLGLSLTYDHRAIDGGEATRFLKQIAVEIENLDIDI